MKKSEMHLQYVCEFEISKKLYNQWARRPMGHLAKTRMSRYYFAQTAGLLVCAALAVVGAVWVKNTMLTIMGLTFALIFVFRIFIQPVVANNRQYDLARKAQHSDKWVRRVSFGDDIQVVDGKSTTTMAYAELKDVTEDAQLFYIWRDEDFLIRLPKSGFTDGSVAGFTDFLRGKMAQAAAAENTGAAPQD